MYGMRETKGQYQTYTLYDTAENSSFTINPERGGIVTEFSVGEAGNILYMNDGIYRDPSKYIRGGIPVLFPMAGRLTGDKYQVQGETYSMPVHGLVRNYPWEIRKTNFTDGAEIVVGMQSNEETKKAFPFSFDVEFTYRLKGSTLAVEQAFKNLSSRDMPVSFGFHPYFRVLDKKNAKVLLDADTYKDMVSGAVVPAEEVPDFTGEHEVGCLFQDVRGQKAVLKADGCHIELEFDCSYRHVLLWSLPNEEFICVEPWTAKPDALNTNEELIRIGKGECVRSYMAISVFRDTDRKERTGTVCW